MLYIVNRPTFYDKFLRRDYYQKLINKAIEYANPIFQLDNFKYSLFEIKTNNVDSENFYEIYQERINEIRKHLDENIFYFSDFSSENGDEQISKIENCVLNKNFKGNNAENTYFVFLSPLKDETLNYFKEKENTVIISIIFNPSLYGIVIDHSNNGFNDIGIFYDINRNKKLYKDIIKLDENFILKKLNLCPFAKSNIDKITTINDTLSNFNGVNLFETFNYEKLGKGKIQKYLENE